MNKKDDIRNYEDGMERQGPTQALPKGYPSFTQGLGLLKSMARVCLQYVKSMPKVCLRYADATPMVRLRYADATPTVCQEHVWRMPRARFVRTPSLSRADAQSVPCEHPVRPLRTTPPLCPPLRGDDAGKRGGGSYIRKNSIMK